MELSDTHRTTDGFVGGIFVIVELFSFELDRRKNIMFNKLNSTIYTFYEIKTSIPYIFRNENQIRPSTLIVINQATRYFMIHPVSIYLERIRKCSSPVLISSIYITIPFEGRETLSDYFATQIHSSTTTPIRLYFLSK